MRALSVGLTNLSALQVIKTSKLDKRLAPLEAIGVIDSIVRPNSNTKLVSSGSSMSTTEECEDTLEMSSPDTSKVGKKSKKEKRSEAYNCGLCNEICENEAILCDTCHNFYHSKCENITPSLKLQLSYLMQEFVCSNCCQKDNYDFEAAISRLSQSAVIGQLDSGVQMEKILLRDKPEFNVQHTLQKGKYVIDRVARSILKKYAKHITSFPVAIERDGNCLFSALSVAVHGNATKAAELRTRTAIEMVSHRKFYQSVHVRSGILLVSPDLEEACLDCAQNGCYSSAWTIHAASSVLGRPIRSIYPPVNGLHDRCYEIMDRTFSPRILIDSSDVTIMWSGENPSGRKAWIPNHFVPLLRLEKDDPIVENTDLQYTAVYTMVNNEVVVSTDNSGISLELDPAILYESIIQKITEEKQKYQSAHNANKIRPIKIEKFRNDSRFDETSYYFKDGLRYVKPYSFVFQCHIKGRWFGKKIIDVCKKEFRAEAPDFYEKSIAVGLLKINGKRVKHGRTLWNNELLTSRVHRHEPPVSGEPIRIIHSDDDVVVVDKPASIPVHPCGKYRHNTLVFILGKEYGFTGLHTIHRLDRLTSGLLIFARTAEVSKKLDAYVRDREVEKKYLCKVKGQFPSDPIICEEPIQIVSHKIGVCRVSPQGKTCKTTFQSLSYDGETSIVQCVPHTGRMHQIRVHLQYLGYPITNDPLYNNPVWGTEFGKHDSATRITDEELIQRLLIQRDEELLERLVEDNHQSFLDPDEKDNVKGLRKRTDETERDESNETLPKKFKSYESVQDNKESDNMEIIKIKEIISEERDYSTNSNLSNIETTKIKVDNSEIIDFNKVQCYQEIKGIEGSEGIKSSEGIDCKAESSIDIPETSTSSFNLTQQIKCDEVIKEAECGDTKSGINLISTTSEKIISESKDTASTVDGSDCVSEKADGCDAFLPPEVAMLRDGETEEDRLNRIVMTLCRDCKVKYRDPIDSELRIYLHALRYKGPDFDYSTEVPSWAQEHLDRCQNK